MAPNVDPRPRAPGEAKPPKQDAWELDERRRIEHRQLRKWALITTGLAFLLAVSEADHLYFQEGNMWTSWGLVPIGFIFLFFPVGYTVGSIWALRRYVGILRGDQRVRTPRYAGAPLPPKPGLAWPIVTVQVPIYTEPFSGVIRPSLDSALAALRRYTEATGQRANLLVCDDGLLVLAGNDLEAFLAKARGRAPSARSEAEIEVLTRLDYYARHEVAWVARAKPVKGVPETERRGRFKKASNLNHAFELEQALAALGPEGAAALPAFPRRAGEPLPGPLSRFRFAQWSGAIEVGELILQLDKDSICHPEIIVATAPEFVEAPELAYTQHASYPTNETDNYFSMAVGYFTRHLYEVAIPAKSLFDGSQVPVMGHNLFFRKSVLLQNGLWGEMTCEDLDFMMKTHIGGYHGRYVNYPGLEFGEAVTRTFTEEMEKFRRYAFGAAEAILNPLAEWDRLGLLKKSFRRFAHSPYVGWYHLVDLVGFFFSLINIASILPGAIALGLGWSPIARALARLIMTLLVFQVIGAGLAWAVRRKGNLGRVTSGTAWRGAKGVAWATFSLLALGPCFMGYSIAIIRGGLSYLFNSSISFAATATDDLDRVSFWEILRRMKSSHVEAGVLGAVGLLLAAYSTTRPEGLGLHTLLWATPLGVHVAIPYIMNPYLVGKVVETLLGAVGLAPGRAPVALETGVTAPAAARVRAAERR